MVLTDMVMPRQSNYRFPLGVDNNNMMTDGISWIPPVLIVMMYLKTVPLNYFETQFLLIDILFYTVVFISLLMLKLNKYAIAIFPVLALSVVNSAASNFFLILSSTYILSYTVSLKGFCKINIFCILGVIVIILLLKEAGMIEEHHVRNGMFVNGVMYNVRIRSDLGFGNPNAIGIILYALYINTYLILPKRFKWVFILSCLGITYWIFTITDSRTFLISTVVFLLFIISLSSSKFKGVLYKSRKVLIWIPLAFLLLIFFVIHTGFYNMMVDIATSGRLGLYSKFLSGISMSEMILGTPKLQEETIDNSYIQLLLSAGFYGFFFFYWLWYKYIKKLNYTAIWIYPVLISFICYGLAESIWLMPVAFGNMVIWVMMMKNIFLPEKLEEELVILSN
ncbi:MAG: hypothetical protein K2M13_02470 [Muribaculaceae bacterium]|nr:hypothetical protein [Muribaculaceae bacterium]